jgi:hypothetical protein
MGYLKNFSIFRNCGLLLLRRGGFGLFLFIMIFYCATLLFPLLLVIFTILLFKKYPSLHHSKWLIFFTILLVMWLYSLIIYLIEYNNCIRMGWAFYSLIFFLLPISIITIIIYFLFAFLTQKENFKNRLKIIVKDIKKYYSK